MQQKDMSGFKQECYFSHVNELGVDTYCYGGWHMPWEHVLKCEEDQTYFKCIRRNSEDNVKKITRAHWHFDKYDIEDGKIRLVSKLKPHRYLEGYEFIGLDGEPCLLITYDPEGHYKTMSWEK